MKYLSFTIIIFSSLQPLISSFDLRIKYFRSDEEANGTRFYALDFLGMIEKHGRQAEWHNVTTDDGYILSLFRIPPNPEFHNETRKTHVVYLQHRLLAAADIFILFGPGRSLAYLLSDAGYDVWIGNLRGNSYSRKHKKYSDDDSEFWNFSMDEYAYHDLPAMLDYIIETTGQQQLSYIGHSLGSTLMLMLLAEKPQYNSKLTVIVLLAPVSYWKTWNLPRILFAVASFFFQIFVPGGAIEFPTQTVVKPAIFQYFCLQNVIFSKLCSLPFSILLGDDPEQFDMARDAVYVNSHYPAGGSAKVLQHYGQHTRSGKFGYYEYGSTASNHEAYGQNEAPTYNLSNIRAPTIIFAGKNDPLATLENVENLITKLPKNLELKYEIIKYEKFTHRDFMMAIDVNKILYEPLLKILENFYESKEGESN